MARYYMPKADVDSRILAPKRAPMGGGVIRSMPRSRRSRSIPDG